MQVKRDAELLREYVSQKSEAAFRELVERYTALVYSAAFRQCGSPQVAEDLTQSVFTVLARKAPTLARNMKENDALAGWLYRSSQYAVSNHLRGEHRRRARESMAMPELHSAPETPPDWESVRPILDDVLLGLDEEDRQAMLLRFFQNQEFRAIGESLGISGDAAQKRVERALEKLRGKLAGLGIESSIGMLSGVLAARAIETAPTGMAVRISAASVAGAKVKTATTVTLMAMNAYKVGAIAAGVAGFIGASVIAVHYHSENSPAITREVHGDIPTTPSPLTMAEFRAKTVETVNTIKYYGVASRIYAGNHQGAMPTSIEQMTGLVDPAKLTVPPDVFELVDHGGQLNNNDPKAIYMREKSPRQSPDGSWMRVYLFADGSAQMVSSPTSNYEETERNFHF